MVGLKPKFQSECPEIKKDIYIPEMVGLKLGHNLQSKPKKKYLHSRNGRIKT